MERKTKSSSKKIRQEINYRGLARLDARQEKITPFFNLDIFARSPRYAKHYGQGNN